MVAGEVLIIIDAVAETTLVVAEVAADQERRGAGEAVDGEHKLVPSGLSPSMCEQTVSSLRFLNLYKN